MRLYTFGNYYLSSIQQSIQALHVVADMFVKYQNDSSWALKSLYDWAENHKTVVCLNGGNSGDLFEVYKNVSSFGHQLALPYASFKEDEQSLNNALTCVGIVVPEKIYGAAEILRKIKEPLPSYYSDLNTLNNLANIQREFAEFLNNFGLAK